MSPPEVIIQYQKTIVDHLVAIGSIPLDEQGLEAMLVQLVELLDKDFISIGEFEVGDEIIASHGGLVIYADEHGRYGVEVLAQDVRLHGSVLRLVPWDAPIEETFVIDPDLIGISQKQSLTQIAAALELKDSQIEYEGRFEPFPKEGRVYLPLCYPDMHMKKQIASS